MFKRLVACAFMLLSASALHADVTIIVVPGGGNNCLTRLYNDILQPGDWGSIGDTSAPTRFVQSDQGTLGLTLFFETRPSDGSNYSVQVVMQSIGFTAINRTSTTGFLPRYYTTFKAITKNMSSVWVSKADGTGDLQSQQKSQLPNILNEAPDSQNCNGLIWALQTGQAISFKIGGGSDPGHPNVSPLLVQNYMPGDLWFNSTGRSPNSGAYFIGSASTPRYPSGSYLWSFYGQTNVKHGLAWY